MSSGTAASLAACCLVLLLPWIRYSARPVKVENLVRQVIDWLVCG